MFKKQFLTVIVLPGNDLEFNMTCMWFVLILEHKQVTILTMILQSVLVHE